MNIFITRGVPGYVVKRDVDRNAVAVRAVPNGWRWRTPIAVPADRLTPITDRATVARIVADLGIETD